eukprot:5538302-Prymnesium_polylepis.1
MVSARAAHTRLPRPPEMRSATPCSCARSGLMPEQLACCCCWLQQAQASSAVCSTWRMEMKD